MKEFISNVFDTETTGLVKPKCNDLDKQPYITEIYVAKLLHKADGSIEQIDEFDQMFNIPIPVSPEITKITGITESDLVGKPTFHESFKDLAQFFVGAQRIVAHNLSFDRNMLLFEMARINKQLMFPWCPDHICTVEKTMHIEQRRMNLTNLHKHLFGCDFPDAHRAKNDVLPLVRCYIELIKLGDIK